MRQEVNTILELWRKFFLDVLEEAVAEGSINPVHDPEDAARLLLAVVDGLAIQTVNGTYGSSPEDMRRLLYRFAAAELGVDTSAWESTLACAAEH